MLRNLQNIFMYKFRFIIVFVTKSAGVIIVYSSDHIKTLFNEAVRQPSYATKQINNLYFFLWIHIKNNTIYGLKFCV